MSSRRWVLAGLLALAVATPAGAEERRVPVKKVFPYLDAYLRIPAGQRSRFVPVYVFAKTRPTGLWVVEGAARMPLPIGADGRVLRLPTGEQMERGEVLVSGADKARYSVRLEMHPLIAPAAEMDAASLAAAVAQAGAAVKAFAGPLSFAAPKFSGVLFQGGAQGEVIYADGRRATLPLDKGVARFNPADHPGARVVHFTKAPASLIID